MCSSAGRSTEGNVVPCKFDPGESGKECGFERPEPERIERFVKTLEQRHVPVTLRREMGKNIDAACGQLRAKAERKTDGRIN